MKNVKKVFLETKLYEEEDEIPGGLGDHKTAKDVAEKFGVSVEDVEKELEMGIEVEYEHTHEKSKAEEIAIDHLMEFPDYYTRLEKMEEKGEEEWEDEAE